MKTSAQRSPVLFTRSVLITVVILVCAFITPVFAMSGVDQKITPPPAHETYASLNAVDIFELPGDIYISKGKYYQYVELKWKGHPDANCYQVYRKVAGTEDRWELIEIIENGNTQLHDNGAVPGVVYEYEVRALKLNKWTKKEISLEKWRDSGYRKTKTLDKTDQVKVIWDNNRGELEWSSVPRADYYRLQIVCGASSEISEEEQGYVIVDNLDNLLVDRYIKDTIYHFEQPNLSPNAVCYFRVRAENDMEISDYTNFTPVFSPFESVLHEQDINGSSPISVTTAESSPYKNELKEGSIDQRPFREISSEQKQQNSFYPDFRNINKKEVVFGLNENGYGINSCLNIQISQRADPSVQKLLKTQILTIDSTGMPPTFRIRIDEDQEIQLKTFMVFDSRGNLIDKVKNRLLPKRECIDLWKSDAPEGSYYYKLLLESKNGQSEQFNGNIVILK